jgi:predicted dehydrogenase/threonine dehydrogenase-like Zn-dependent dehydrogenase
MLTSFGKAGCLDKARLQPERLRQVFEKVRTDGLLATVESVRARLERPIELGYCNVGQVIAVGEGVSGFSVGDRVVSNRPHAELVVAPRNLCARVPAGVDDEQAAFAVVTAIGLQGVRLTGAGIGDSVVVAGLGLIGLLSVQILRAAGCRVIGFDPDAGRVTLARELGADAFVAGTEGGPAATVIAMTAGTGADAVLITASTSDDGLVSQCAQMCRKRGHIVLTGVVGLNLRRADFYEKELTFQVSCSYGPGRYDPDYEDRGIDYPQAYVRWTAGRNFSAALDLMADGRVVTDRLVTHRAPFVAAAAAFERLDQAGEIGILLEYPAEDGTGARAVGTAPAPPMRRARAGAMAVIGAGAFTQARILPSLRRAGAPVAIIASAGGTSAAIAARRFGIPNSTTDIESIVSDESIAAIVVSTRHDQHAALVQRALRAGKHVFVEKPLCLTDEELDAIASTRLEALARTGSVPAVVVGFNRRHAPLARRMRDAMLRRAGPAFVIYTCNAGALPPSNWVHDPAVGGGRLIGEACHFIDFIQFLVGSPIGVTHATRTRLPGADLEDCVAITFGFEDGSVGQVNYHSIGNRASPKERCEAAFDGKTIVLDNFRRLTGYGAKVGGRSWRQDKGHDAQFSAFWRLVSGAEVPAGFPVPFETVTDVMRATFRAARAMRGG